MKTDYEKQATDFLTRNGIKFRATLADSKLPPWDDEKDPRPRHHYRVTLSHENSPPPNAVPKDYGKRLTFDFWASIADAGKGIREASAYDVLSSVSCDASAFNDYDSFEAFCDNFGYDRDSIKALQTYRRGSAFGKRLRAFFTERELEQLAEIQ